MLTRSLRRGRPALRMLIPLAVLAALFLYLHVRASDARAQTDLRDWNDPDDTLQGAVGLHYGQIGGHGLAFRLPLRWFLYFQAAGGLWHTADNKKHNYGFNLNYILRQDQRMRLFLSGGAAYFFEDEKDGAGVWHEESDWNYGGGVGVEVLQGRRWSWKVEGDFIHYGNSGDIKITGQVGLFYYW